MLYAEYFSLKKLEFKAMFFSVFQLTFLQLRWLTKVKKISKKYNRKN